MSLAIFTVVGPTASVANEEDCYVLKEMVSFCSPSPEWKVTRNDDLTNGVELRHEAGEFRLFASVGVENDPIAKSLSDRQREKYIKGELRQVASIFDDWTSVTERRYHEDFGFPAFSMVSYTELSRSRHLMEQTSGYIGDAFFTAVSSQRLSIETPKTEFDGGLHDRIVGAIKWWEAAQ